MKKTRIKLPVKLILSVTAIFIALAVVSAYFTAALRNLDYFKVKDIASNMPEGTPDFSYLAGRNIFNIDLKRESRYISGLYPVYKNIRLFRILPDRLSAVFTQRNPVACVKLYRYFLLDDERVLFDLPQGEGAGDLPVIIGLERKIPGPKSGKQYNIRELVVVLNIIKEARSDNSLKGYRIARIDAAKLADITCFLRLQDSSAAQGINSAALLEVKMSQDDIGGKVRVLSGLLSQLKEDISRIKYIDLRFKEPVVKFKDAA